MGVASTKNYHGELPKNTWEQTPSPTPHNIYQHKDDPENQLEEYQICLEDADKLGELCDMFEWRKRSQYLVASEWMELEEKGGMCSTLHRGKLYLEYLPVSLCDVTDVPYPDVLHLYHQVLQGCFRLTRKIGNFALSQDCVGINMKGVAKVWCHHNYDRTYPYAPAQEAQLVSNIMDVIDNNTNHYTLPPNIPPIREYIEENGTKSLDGAIKRVQEYADRFFMGSIPPYLKCVALAGGPANIRSSCRHLHSSFPSIPSIPSVPTKRIQTSSQIIEKVKPSPPVQQPTIVNVPQNNIPLHAVRPNTIVHIQPTHAHIRPSEQRQPQRRTQPLPEPIPNQPVQNRQSLPIQQSLPMNSVPPSNQPVPQIAKKRTASNAQNQKQVVQPQSNTRNQARKQPQQIFSEVKEQPFPNTNNQQVKEEWNYQPQTLPKQETVNEQQGTSAEWLAQIRSISRSPTKQPENGGYSSSYNGINQYSTSPVLQKQTYYQPQSQNTQFATKYNQTQEYRYESSYNKQSPENKASQYVSSYQYETAYQYTPKYQEEEYQYKPSQTYKPSDQGYSYPAEDTYKFTSSEYHSQPMQEVKYNDTYNVEWDPDILADLQANVHKK